jgi:hypothetical protein
MSMQQALVAARGQFGRRLPATATVQAADDLLRRRGPSTSDRIRLPYGESRLSLEGPVRTTTASDDGGRFSFTQLAPGTYTIHAVKAGFDRLERNDVVVGAAVPVSLDATLSPSSFSPLQTIGRTSRCSARRPRSP